MLTKEQESIDFIIRKGSLKQGLVCFLIGSVCSVISIETYMTNFLTPYQEFWCSVPQIQNCSYEKQKELVLPQISSQKNPDYCKVINLTWSYDEGSCDFEDHEEFSEKENIKCDTGFQFNTSIFILTATSRFQLVCDNAWVHELMSPVFLASYIIGAFLSGFISDGYGRKLSLSVFLVIHTFGGIIVTFSPNVWLLLVGRTIVGLSVRAIGISVLTLLVEFAPKRDYAGILYEFHYAIVFICVTFLSYFIRDYRWLQLSTSFLYIPLILFWSIIPESPYWLISNGYYEKAKKELTRLASWANTPIDDDLFEDYLKSINISSDSQKSIDFSNIDETNLSIFDILKHKKLVIYMIASSLGILSVFSSYIGSVMNMGLFFGDLYLNLLISALSELSAVLVFWFVSDKFGRKTIILTSQALQILLHLTQVVLILLPGFTQVVLIPGFEFITTIVALVCKLTSNFVAPLVNVITLELFPAKLRQRALGYSIGVATIFSCFCPIIGGKFKLIWAPIPNIVFGFLTFLSFVAFLFVPETKNRNIPNTLEDALQESSECDKIKKISNILPPDQYIHNSEFIGTYRYFSK